MDVAVCGGGNTAPRGTRYLSEIYSKVYLYPIAKQFAASPSTSAHLNQMANVQACAQSATVSA